MTLIRHIFPNSRIIGELIAFLQSLPETAIIKIPDLGCGCCASDSEKVKQLVSVGLEVLLSSVDFEVGIKGYQI